MITAVDTSVLLDVFTADPVHGHASRSALRDSLQAGNVLICEVVWAETAAAFPDLEAAAAAIAELGGSFSALDETGAMLAASAWREYRRAGGPRTRLIADFLIGAHAFVTADRLLTRDRGFYKRYFADVPVFDPSV